MEQIAAWDRLVWQCCVTQCAEGWTNINEVLLMSTLVINFYSEKRKLIIPPSLAYGPQGQPPTIPRYVSSFYALSFTSMQWHESTHLVIYKARALLCRHVSVTIQ